MTRGAETLKAAGSTESLDVRRSMAVGELGRHQLARVEHHRHAVTAEQVKTWCANPETQVAVKPVIDLTDHDHVIAYDQGGTTSSDNIAPSCRRHHRLRTPATWRCTILEAGSFPRSSPHGHQFLRDHHGTLDVSHDPRPPPDGHAEPPHQ